MCNHDTEARSIEGIRERHRSEEAEAPLGETHDADAADGPAGELEEREPPNRVRRPTTDAAVGGSAPNSDDFLRRRRAE